MAPSDISSGPQHGADSALSPVSTQAGDSEQHPARGPARAPRSCHQCHKRKVRCDKIDPCTPCSRAGKECVFPPAGPRVRRSKKTLNAEMASRLEQLERKIGDVTRTKNTPAARSPSPPKTLSDRHSTLVATPSQTGTASETEIHRWREHGDVLLHRQGSYSQYFNDIVLSRVINGERHVQNALATPAASTSAPKGPSPYSPLGILSPPDPTRPAHIFHPAKDVAIRLWQRYFEVVDDCMNIRVLHVPTDEVTVFTTIQNPQASNPDDLALCFAIYFTTCAALPTEDAEAVLKQDTDQGVLNLKSGFEQAMAQSNFLDHPNPQTLKALAIFMTGLRIRHRGKGLWLINGLALRAAKSLGYQIDGERLGLSPFKSELRRRNWWFFVIIDCRANEDFGLPGTGDVSHLINVRRPLNIEDVDLFWDMEELPPPRKEWTAMTPYLIHIEGFMTGQKLNSISASSDPSGEVRQQIVDEARATIDGYLKRANLVIPRQLLTIRIARFVLAKLDFVSRLQWHLIKCPNFNEIFATDEFLCEASDLMEMVNSINEDEVLSAYAIPSRAYPQHHITLYLLWHLCARPLGPNSDRAWDLVRRKLHKDKDFYHNGTGPKTMILDTLAQRVEYLRENPELQRQEPQDVSTAAGPSIGDAGAAPVPSADYGAHWDLPMSFNGHMPGFDLGPASSLNWMSFIPRSTEGESIDNLFWGY